MPRRPGTRSVLLVFLVCLLGAQMAHHAAAADGARPYPDDGDLATAYDAHVGERFYAWTRVVGRAPSGVQVQVGDVRLAVVGVPPGTPGDVLQVYGTLRPGHRVEPLRVVRSDRTSLRYLYGVSLVGAGLTAVLARRRWRIDRGELALVPREGDGRA